VCQGGIFSARISWKGTTFNGVRIHHRNSSCYSLKRAGSEGVIGSLREEVFPVRKNGNPSTPSETRLKRAEGVLKQVFGKMSPGSRVDYTLKEKGGAG